MRQHRGRLLIDYREAGQRQRVYTKLEDNAANRAKLQRIADQVDAALSGTGNVLAVLQQAGLLQVTAPTPPQVEAPAKASPEATVAQKYSPQFSTFAELWFGEFKVGWRKTYITTVRGILDQHLLPRFGTLAIGSVTRAQILDFRSHLSSVRGRRPGTKLSPARINTIMLILRQILQEAADRYEFTLAMGKLRPLKIPKSDVDPFNLEQVHLIINSVRIDYRHYMTVRFFTGMRSGEIHGLKWKYIDFERRLILVRETIVGGEEEYTKTDSSQRDIQMSQVVYDALQEQHKATGKMDYVFCNRAGEPLDTNNFTKRIWYPLLRHLSLTLRRPYQTRHTAATLWLAAGETPEWIARQLGHASTEMLFRVYGRFVPNLTRRDGSAFDRLLATRFTSNTDAGRPAASNEGALPEAQPPPMRAAA
ncbi:MAG: tyrosine-type recombinase/integrase [Burkholderiales bacterium]|nr:tyrosine-type recombinase/integrase [Burkholderiales bacterium]